MFSTYGSWAVSSNLTVYLFDIVKSKLLEFLFFLAVICRRFSDICVVLYERFCTLSSRFSQLFFGLASYR
jgi:hypothetical protein